MNGSASLSRPEAGGIDSYEPNDDGRSVGGSSDAQPFDSANNSFSDVSLASAARSGSPSRPVSRLSRQTLAEHQAATNGDDVHHHAVNGQLHDTTGSLEESIPEMLRIKDLDSGKEYNLDKRYTIRDLNTGQLYVLDGDGEPSSPSDPAAPNSGLVTDVIQGRQLSLDEFEQVLGLNAVLEAARQRRRSNLSKSTGSLPTADSGASLSTADMQTSQGGSKQLKPKGNWLKSRLFNKSGTSLKGMEADDSDATSRASSSGSLHADLQWVDGSPTSSRTATGSSATTSGRTGIPTKVTLHKKAVKSFPNLAVVQELYAHTGVIWCMKFSKNGKYVATAGQEGVIRVWEVILQRGKPQTNPTDSPSTAPNNGQQHQNGTEGVPHDGGVPERPQDTSTLYEGYCSDCPVLSSKPYRVYQGHKQDVLELCWSKSQFVLSASMDKTVKLWHLSMGECLRTFKHTDFVTALDFHPADDKYFLSGSIDGKVRMWNIPEQQVVDWADVHEMVTAVNFAPEGAKAIVGTMKGKCRFYRCSNFHLEYEAQIDVKNKRSGDKKSGKKITGMQFLGADNSKLLITSNDSRIRLYDGLRLQCKYKGHSNRNTQIRASFAADGQSIICGSDDGHVYIWNTDSVSAPPSDVKKESIKEKSSSYECFHAHDDIITVAVFAPDTASRIAALQGVGAGQVILTAGYSGEIKVFENLPTSLT